MTVRVARLTPPGTGAIASIAIVGDGAWAIIRALFRRADGASLVEIPKVGSLLFGQFGPPPGDEVVLALKRLEPEPWFEIHAHGGRVLVDWILEQLGERGAQSVSWPELEANRLRGQAAEALSRALTSQAAAILLNQYHGALEREIHAILALIDTAVLQAALDQLTATARIGLHLTTPFRVAVFGPPNAGKSSLVNRVAGYERAVVSPTPGTTRELTTTVVAIDGWPIELFDSPGIRDAGDELEREGQQRGLSVLRDQPFDAALWVIDGTEPFISSPTEGNFDLIVANKSDLAKAIPANCIAVSALTGDGIPELETRLIRHLIEPATLDGGVLFSQDLVDVLAAARASLNEGQLSRTRQLLRSIVQPEKSQS